MSAPDEDQKLLLRFIAVAIDGINAQLRNPGDYKCTVLLRHVKDPQAHMVITTDDVPHIIEGLQQLNSDPKSELGMVSSRAVLPLGKKL